LASSSALSLSAIILAFAALFLDLSS